MGIDNRVNNYRAFLVYDIYHTSDIGLSMTINICLENLFLPYNSDDDVYDPLEDDDEDD